MEASESVFLPVGGLAPPLGATIVQPPAIRRATVFGHGVRLVAGWPRFHAAPCVSGRCTARIVACYRTDPTRLETRTKESNMCASIWVANPYA